MIVEYLKSAIISIFMRCKKEIIMNGSKRYLQIYEQVKDDIIAGRYKVGAKLPSKRIMAEAMGVSVITIQHAYELLSEEGYIYPKEKSGYFVSFDEPFVLVFKNGFLDERDMYVFCEERID